MCIVIKLCAKLSPDFWVVKLGRHFKGITGKKINDDVSIKMTNMEGSITFLRIHCHLINY